MTRIEVKDLKEGQIIYEYHGSDMGYTRYVVSEDAKRIENNDKIRDGWICFAEDGTRFFVADGFEHKGPELYVKLPSEISKELFPKREDTPEELDERLKEYLSYIDEEILIAAGFSEAFIGISETIGGTVAVYSTDKIINILMKRYQMPYDDALAYLELNIISRYIGERTPIFLDFVPDHQWNI